MKNLKTLEQLGYGAANATPRIREIKPLAPALRTIEPNVEETATYGIDYGPLVAPEKPDHKRT